MAGWKKGLIVLGGVIAVIGQFWGADTYYLPLIGGAIAAIFGLLTD